jgi:hypothetical protein
MKLDWKSYQWLQISLWLILVACCLPALELTTTSGPQQTPVAHNTMWGFQILLRGYFGIFNGIIAWFANPLWALALLLVSFKRLKATLAVSLASLVIALTTFLIIGKDLAVWESDLYRQHPSAFLPGTFPWIASLASVPLACLLKISGMNRKPQ